MSLIQFAAFTIDTQREVVLCDKSPVALRPQSFRVLCFLAEHQGQLVTKQEVFAAVWGDTVVTDDSLTQCLVEIRKALGDEDRSLIRTVPRRGYILEAPELDSTQNQQGTGSPTQPELPGRSTGLTLAVLSAFSLLLAIGVWWLIAKPGTGLSQPVVAVLPFEDLTPAGNNAYIGEGISEEIINSLAGLRGLGVIARTSSFSPLLRQGQDVREIGELLGASHVIEGSIRVNNNRLRITVQLIDTANGHHLWSENFDHETPDIMRIQSVVAAATANAFRLQALQNQALHAEIRADDYQRFLQARYQLNRSRPRNLAGIRAELEGLWARNPRHLGTAIALGQTYIRMASFDELGLTDTAHLVSSLGDALASLPEGETAAAALLGEVALNVRINLAEAQKHIQFVLAKSRSSEHLLLAASLAEALRRYDSAKGLYQESLYYNPLCMACSMSLAYLDIARGDLQGAEQHVQRMRSQTIGGDFSLALVKTLQGDYAAAATLVDRGQSGSRDRYRNFYRAILLFTQGELAAFNTLFAQYRDQYGDTEPRRIAQLYALSDQKNEAFKWIDVAEQTDRHWLLKSLIEPMWNNLREDARWQAVLSRYGRSDMQLAELPEVEL